MSKPSLVVVLAEDQRHQRFIRSFLYEKGFERHQIRLEPLPSGRGCGEQWVRQRYAAIVKAFRSRAVKAESAVVVAIDSDVDEISRRQQQFAEALELAGLERRRNDEKIVHLIPRRSIETWIFYLAGEPVGEVTDYSHRAGVDEFVAEAGRAFLALTRSCRSHPVFGSRRPRSW